MLLCRKQKNFRLASSFPNIIALLSCFGGINYQHARKPQIIIEYIVLNLLNRERFFLKPLAAAPGTHLVEAIHDVNFSSKKGYDLNFLSTTVELPALSAGMLGSVAVNHQPGINGRNYLDYTNFSILFNREMKLPFLTAVNIAGEEDELALAHEPRPSDIWFQDERIKVQKDFSSFQTAIMQIQVSEGS